MIDDSEGLFGKRRRNLMIVGIIIIILALLKPTLKEITLFGIVFDFTDKLWVIWIGLTVWFGYAAMRVYSYYNSYVRDKIKSSINLFVYWEGGGHKYWKNLLEVKRQELEDQMKDPQSKTWSPTPFVRLAHVGLGDNSLKSFVANGDIPGTLQMYFVKEAPGTISPDITLDVEFSISSEQQQNFIKRRAEYRVNDEWWEYTFTKMFGIVSLCALSFGWIRVILQF